MEIKALSGPIINAPTKFLGPMVMDLTPVVAQMCVPRPSRPVLPYSGGGQGRAGRAGPRHRSTGDERGRAVALSPFFLRCLWRFTTHRLSHRRDFSAPAVYKEMTLLNFCAVVHSGLLWEDSSDCSGNGLVIYFKCIN